MAAPLHFIGHQSDTPREAHDQPHCLTNYRVSPGRGVLIQHKPSTQVTIRSHLRKHLVPFFGRLQMREIGPEEVQRFVSSVRRSAKTVKNLFATMQMLWKSARAWSYVAHDAVSDVVLPKRHRVAQRFFSVEEVQRILAAASEPYHTFY